MELVGLHYMQNINNHSLFCHRLPSQSATGKAIIYKPLIAILWH
jgi:hypothetical protein